MPRLCVALGFPEEMAHRSGQAQLIQECCECIRGYFRAWESGDWEKEAPLFASVVNYYDDGDVDRAFIRETRRKENARWPHRRVVLLNRIASLEPAHADAVQVTARVRREVSGRSGPAPRARKIFCFDCKSWTAPGGSPQ